ncbi:MAG TPA: alpha/beta family hydrolase [Candidatus Eisenbacteria bacterium]|jgi:hypothetical protein
MKTTARALSTPVRFRATERAGEVSGLLLLPRDARCLLVLAHGAGAGMHHPFLDAMASHLTEHGVATFRYQFPYSEHGSGRPDPRPVLLATVRSAVTVALERAGDLPLVAGGKSMGGRMTSLAAAESALPGVRALVFVGFPLHPAGTPGVERAEHLARVTVPMLFLQGTRDALAELDLLRPVCDRLGALATLHVVEGADHSFHVLKRSGSTDHDVLRELAATTASWVSKRLAVG